MPKKLTKAQQAEAREAAMRAALSWPYHAAPEPLSGAIIAERTAPLGIGDDQVIRLWTYNAYTRRVTHGCVSRIYHSTEGEKATSQTQGGPWFDAQEEAYCALRWAVRRRMAGELADLDRQMDRDLAEAGPA